MDLRRALSDPRRYRGAIERLFDRTLFTAARRALRQELHHDPLVPRLERLGFRHGVGELDAALLRRAGEQSGQVGDALGLEPAAVGHGEARRPGLPRLPLKRCVHGREYGQLVELGLRGTDGAVAGTQVADPWDDADAHDADDADETHQHQRGRLTHRSAFELHCHRDRYSLRPRAPRQ